MLPWATYGKRFAHRKCHVRLPFPMTDEIRVRHQLKRRREKVVVSTRKFDCYVRVLFGDDTISSPRTTSSLLVSGEPQS